MDSKMMRFTNFTRAYTSMSECYRPDNEQQIPLLLNKVEDDNKSLLARGNGLSYGDCCFNDGGVIIDTSRLNHLIAFDELTETVICQGATTFSDLFLVHPDYIPPVIPGTLFATLAGGIANDIHGKNNDKNNTLGQHIVWIDLQIGQSLLRISREEHKDLFQATIAGLGLTGIIKRAAIKLHKTSRFVNVVSEKHRTWDTLLVRMQEEAEKNTYMVAWLDLQNPMNALLSLANHCDQQIAENELKLCIPPLPIRLISKWGMTLFNQFYFKRATTIPHVQSLKTFNNPLDSIKHWNRLYGNKGLLQFQAVFDESIALMILHELTGIIKTHQATPTLSVLKYFTQSGPGLLSFVKPGFTIAIDFIHNKQAIAAIKAMNETITKAAGKIYLAKDFLLEKEQFIAQYPNYHQFMDILARYPNSFQSGLSRRLGLTS